MDAKLGLEVKLDLRVQIQSILVVFDGDVVVICRLQCREVVKFLKVFPANIQDWGSCRPTPLVIIVLKQAPASNLRHLGLPQFLSIFLNKLGFFLLDSLLGCIGGNNEHCGNRPADHFYLID